MSASIGKVYGDRRLAGSRGAETIGWLCTVWRLVVLALGVLLAPLAAEAQQAGKVPRIGFLYSVSPAPVAPRVEAFRQGLRELGYVEGKNLAIEYRYAEGSPKLLHDLAAELVHLMVDVILAPDTNAALAAKQATATIPIVFASVADPIGRGLAASLARPGGNATGLTPISAELSAKRLELLKEAVPEVSRIAVLSTPAHPLLATMYREMEAAARSLGVQLHLVEVRDPSEFDRAFAAMTGARADALTVLPIPMFMAERRRIVDLAAQSRLPAIFHWREYVEVGGLISYGANPRDLFRRAAAYVDKILKGAKPGDLPVEQPIKFELVINLKTAKALGLTIPSTLLFQADEVIQ